MAKANIDTLYNLQHCLRNILLPVEKTGLDFHIVKNLSKIDREIKRFEKQVNEIKQKYTFKDKDGKPILYAIEVRDEKKGTYLFDQQGEFIVVKDSQTVPAATRINETSPDYRDEIIKMEEDEKEIEFHVFPKNKVTEGFENGTLAKLDLAALVGILIEE